MRTIRGTDRRAAILLLLPAAIGLAAFTLVPIISALLLALFDYPLLGDPSFLGWGNFRRMFERDPLFWQVVRNTLTFVVLYVPLNFVISLGLAVWIGPQIRGRALLRVLFFIPVVAPIIANAAVFRLLFANTGIVNQLIAKVGIEGPNWTAERNWAMVAVLALSLWQGLGYNIIVYSAALDSVPDSIHDAALMDGASPRRRFLHVTLPLITPSVFFATVLTLITSFQAFVQPFVLTDGGPSGSTTTLVMHLYRTAFRGGFELGYAAALGLVLFAMIMLVTGVQFGLQRRWVHYED
jgi:multiple sugar transport system permease protein